METLLLNSVIAHLRHNIFVNHTDDIIPNDNLQTLYIGVYCDRFNSRLKMFSELNLIRAYETGQINELKRVKLPDNLHTVIYELYIRYKPDNNEFPDDQYIFNIDLDDLNNTNNVSCDTNNLHTIIYELNFGKKMSEIIFPNDLHTIDIINNGIGDLDIVNFPDNLHTIIFRNEFNQNIDIVKFPNNLHTIQFGHGFNQDINNIIFPVNLHTIKFGPMSNHEINSINFPDNLHTIDLSLIDDHKYLEKIFIQHHIKEIIVNMSSTNIIKLPYGCIETIYGLPITYCHGNDGINDRHYYPIKK